VPVLSRLTGLLYRLVGLANHRQVHRSGHQAVKAAVAGAFRIEATRVIRPLGGPGCQLFVTWRARKGLS
jgi:hypothetical protein